MRFSVPVLIIFMILGNQNAYSQLETSKWVPDTDGLDFSGQWFFAYSDERTPQENSNEFLLKRGYVTVLKRFDKTFSIRVTQDIAVDHDGDGMGDIEIRLKYGYLRIRQPRFLVFHKPFIEFGLVHRPWLDFEQKINRYRVQGRMFLERYGILRSADYGVMAGALLGGDMHPDYQKNVSKNYPGKYGSIALGLFNGGGYEEVENNNDKLIEGRISIRPLPETLPGLQISYAGAIGKGNTELAPDFNFHNLFLSLETRKIILAAQRYSGLGSLQGTVLDENNKSLKQDGYSIFGELSIGQTRFKPFVRHDFFHSDLYSHKWSNKGWIAGLAYHFLNKSKVLIDYDYLETREPDFEIHRVFEIALEFAY